MTTGLKALQHWHTTLLEIQKTWHVHQLHALEKTLQVYNRGPSFLKKIGHSQIQHAYQGLHQLVADDIKAIEQSYQVHETRLSVKANVLRQVQAMSLGSARSPEVLKRWQTLAHQLTHQYQTAFERYQSHVNQLKTLQAEKLISFNTFQKAMIDYQAVLNQATYQEKMLTSTGLQCFDKLKEASLSWKESLSQSFADLLVEGRASFKQLSISILKDMTRIAIQQKMLNPIFDTIFGNDNNPFGLFKKAFAKHSSSMHLSGLSGMKSFGGHRAQGGNLLASHMYLAGERGPELLTTNSHATVTPLSKLAEQLAKVSLSGSLSNSSLGGGYKSKPIQHTVEIINQSHAPLSVTDVMPQVDMQRMVTQIVVNDLHHQGVIHQQLQHTLHQSGVR